MPSDDSKEVVAKICDCMRELLKSFGKVLLTNDGLTELCENIHALLSGKTLCQDDGEDDDETSTDDDDMDHDGKVLSSTCELINGVAEAFGEEFSALFCNHVKDPLVKRAKPSSPMDDRIAVSGTLADLVKYMPVTMNSFTDQLLQLCKL